jgi:Myb-like DNA-binding domain
MVGPSELRIPQSVSNTVLYLLPLHSWALVDISSGLLSNSLLNLDIKDILAPGDGCSDEVTLPPLRSANAASHPPLPPVSSIHQPTSQPAPIHYYTHPAHQVPPTQQPLLLAPAVHHGQYHPAVPAPIPAKGLSHFDIQQSEPQLKKMGKWTPKEDQLAVQLRSQGMKWDDISKRLPGRSAISCRLRYQNYSEKRPDWDKEKKDKLAKLYYR